MNRRSVTMTVFSLLLVLTSTARPGTADWTLTPQHVADKAAAAGRVAIIVELGGTAATPEHLLPHGAAISGQRQNIRQAQAAVRRSLRGLGHRVHREYTSVPYMAIEVDLSALRVLEGMRGLVTRIDEDIELRPMLGQSGPLVQAPTAWAAGFDGSGTVIAIIDSGVDKNHLFFNGRVVEEACYVRGADGAGGSGECPNGLDSQLGSGSGLPCSGCTHGTHVAGIAAGNGAAPADVALSGVARGAGLMAVRVFSAGGSALLSDVLAGLERVYLLRGTHNFAAVNMSLGVQDFPQITTCDGLSPAMTTVIQSLRAAGIATVIASGNDGFADAISFPACIGSAISVASTDDGSFGTTLDRVSDFSNIAPFVSLLAPGKWITSSYPGDIYETISGTSMAAPHVAGALAVLKQAAPTASVTELLDVLSDTGTAIIDQRPGALGTVLPRINIGHALATMSGVQFESAAFSTSEAAVTATITVIRTGPTTSAATVHYASSNGTGIAGSHYVATAGTLTFSPGETSQSFTVGVIDNSAVNPGRTVNLRLSGPTGALLGTPSRAVLTITNDDDGGVIAFGAANVDVDENGGSATVEVVRTGTNLAGGVTVHFATANASAIAGTHYTARSGTLTFAAGVASTTFNVPIVDNVLLGGNRAFQASLSGPGGGGTIGSPATSTVTILENDTAGTFQFSSATYAAREETMAAAITVTRTGTNLGGGVRIAYSSSNGTARAGSDYTAVSGTLTFAAGVTSMKFAVPIANDTGIEVAETINLALNVPAGSTAALGSPAVAALTIEDNDTPSIRFLVAAQSVTEGGTASLMVARSGVNLPPGVTVDYRVTGGTATSGADFTLAAGTLTFKAGQTKAGIRVPTVNDTLVEGAESVVVTLSDPTSGATLGTPASTTLNILDNDSAGVMQFSAAAYRVAENVAGGVFNLRVVRTGTNLASGITVDYAVTGGSATNGVDYTLATGTLTFAADETFRLIPVAISNDGDPEGNETVVVTLSSGSIATTALGAVRAATLTILDDEQALSFSAAAYAVTEGTPAIAIPIVRAGPTPGGTTVTCQTVAGGTAVVDQDYRAVNTTLTFAAGARTVMCVVPILNDTLVDGPVSVSLALSLPLDSSGLLGPLSTAVLTINDNDRGGTIRFGATTYAVAEGGTASLTVLRSGVHLASGVTVNYAVTGGSATSGADFTLADGALAFKAGQTSATIPVRALKDVPFEGNETIVVTLLDATGGGSIGAPAVTTVTIKNTSPRAQVRFLNDLVICNPVCNQRFTGRLTTEQGYVWTSFSGVASPYQGVRHATLSNFVAEAIGFPGTLSFPGSFTIAANRRYLLVATVNAGNIVLVQFDEGSTVSTAESPEVAPSQVQSIPLEPTPGLPFAPLGEAPALR